MARKVKQLQLSCYSIMYSDSYRKETGTGNETVFLTPTEYAGFKRSKKYKKHVVTCNLLAECVVSVKIKIP